MKTYPYQHIGAYVAEEAQADAVRFRQERDRAFEDLKVTQNTLASEKAAIAQQQRRIDDLLKANNDELAKRRKFEAEANQEYCEKLLLRQECIRLRDICCTLASDIEETHSNAGEPIPEDLAKAIDALFPSDPATEAENVA